MRWYVVFGLAFVVTLVIQIWIWHQSILLDENIWIARLHYFQEGLVSGIFPQKHFAHPGFVPLWGALPFVLAGVPAGLSIKMGVSLLVSILVGGIVVMIYYLAPHSWFWMTALGVLAINPIYAESTPINAVTGLALVLGLWGMVLYEKKPRDALLWLVSISFGVGLATHIGMTVLMILPLYLYALYRYGLKKTASMIVIMTATFLILSPSCWYNPIEQLSFMVYIISLHSTAWITKPVTLGDIVVSSPFFVMGLLSASILVILHRIPTWVTRQHLALLIILTFIVSSILFSNQTQSLRYFFPLIFLWETMFAGFIVELGKNSRFSFMAILSLIVVLLGGQTFRLIYRLY